MRIDEQRIAEGIERKVRALTGESPDSRGGDLLVPLLNDNGNAERLIQRHRHELRYCHEYKRWLVYDGRRWDLDATGQARNLAKQTMLAFLEAAIAGRSETAEKFAKSCLDSKRIVSMLWMAEPEIFVKAEELDQDPFLLNFRNGTVDLRTGKLAPHEPREFITKLVDHNYSPEATCPLFLKTLAHMMGATPDASEAELERADRLVSWLQKTLGYALTGSTSEKCLFILHGPTDAGKSTLLELFRWLVKEYSNVIQIDTLMVRSDNIGNNAAADLSDLRGARFVMTSETEEGQRLAEGRLKRICQGQGMIKSCRKYENPVAFPETHKLFMDANHRPTIRGTDNAIWGRLRLIPFQVQIPKDEIDRELPAKLREEAEGILTWAVAGAVRWHQEGLGHPPEIDAAVAEYRKAMDQVGRFIAACCILLPTARVKARPLYTAYRAWAEAAGEHPTSEVLFAQRLEERHIDSDRGREGSVYRGIGLKGPECSEAHEV